MQLPRGTFRSIQKGVNFKEILADMASSRFTGFCTISSSTLYGTLVFRSGICVLAKIQDHYGDKGWAAVMAQPDLVTDLALSDFNTAQIQLALDFNKKARVSLLTPPPPQRSPAAQPVQPSAQPSREQERPAVYPRREQKRRDSVRPAVTEGEVTPDTLPSEDRQIPPEISPDSVKTKESPKEPAQDAAEKNTEKSPESSEESDLDMFDSMDLDDVAHKIRKDCKIILKQLQLDHLTEK